jgi:hypothetical protein
MINGMNDPRPKGIGTFYKFPEIVPFWPFWLVYRIINKDSKELEIQVISKNVY